MADLINELLESVREFDCPVKRTCFGKHWIVVESRNTGLVHLFDEVVDAPPEKWDNLEGKSTLDLAGWIKSSDQLETSLGLAALNSLIDVSGREGNIFTDIFNMIDGKTITVVGRFPQNDQIAHEAGQAFFLEMEPEEGELPASACEEVIPKSDIVVISATALINKTLPRLLELSTAAKAKTFLIGPSTPMSDVLIDHGADFLGGVRVTDTDALIEIVSQGVRQCKKLLGTEVIIKP